MTMEQDNDMELNEHDNECHCHEDGCCGKCQEENRCDDNHSNDTVPVFYEEPDPDDFDDWD